TISMALVICRMFLTLLMRRLMSRADCPAMSGYTSRPGALSPARGELLLECLDSGLQLLHGLVAQVLGLPDLVQDVGGLRPQVPQEAGLKGPDLLHFDIVQVAVDGGVDDGHLLLHGHGLVQALLEDLRHPLAPGQARLGDRKSTRLNSSHVKISYAV